MTKGHGLLIEKQRSPKDWRFGGVSGASREVLRPDGQYLDFLPIPEAQVKQLETMACVSFSALNCIEIARIVKGYEEPNYSDRFLAKMSGTTRSGNYMSKVADTIRTAGCVPEETWPWPESITTWDEYYAPIPEPVQQKGRDWLVNWNVNWEWTPVNLIRMVMPYGPLQVTVEAGNYTRPPTRYNHAVTLIGYEEGKSWTIFDHYAYYGNYVYTLPWNYKFGHAILFTINPKQTNPMQLPNDVMVMETEQTGAFGLHLNGKIIVDDQALVNTSWLFRNNGDVRGKTRTLTKAQWDSFPKRDLKGNDL